MAQRPPWKAHVLAGVIEAAELCVNARDKLICARRFWEEPMRDADVQRALRSNQLLRDYLTDLSGDLALSMGAMVAVQMLSLLGAADDPRVPLPGFQDIPNGDRDVRHAMNAVHRARGCAEAAHNSVQQCRGRLLTAAVLRYYPDLPDVDDFIAAEQATGNSSFEGATVLAADTVAHLTDARRLLGRL